MFITWILLQPTARNIFFNELGAGLALFSNQLRAGLAKFENWDRKVIDHSYLGSIINYSLFRRLCALQVLYHTKINIITGVVKASIEVKSRWLIKNIVLMVISYWVQALAAGECGRVHFGWISQSLGTDIVEAYPLTRQRPSGRWSVRNTRIKNTRMITQPWSYWFYWLILIDNRWTQRAGLRIE